MFTRTTFDLACKALVDTTDYADWTWSEHPRYPGLGFLQRQSVVLLSHSGDDHALVDGAGDVDEPDDESVANIPQSDGERISVCQYVVYSPTFQLPTFYFSMHSSTGNPLSLDDILRTNFFRSGVLPQSERTPYALQLPSAGFPLLSQGEHPTTGAPCWYLHPCETGTALRELLEADRLTRSINDESKRFMELWFLMLANIVHLRTPSS